MDTNVRNVNEITLGPIREIQPEGQSVTFTRKIQIWDNDGMGLELTLFADKSEALAIKA